MLYICTHMGTVGDQRVKFHFFAIAAQGVVTCAAPDPTGSLDHVTSASLMWHHVTLFEEMDSVRPTKGLRGMKVTTFSVLLILRLLKFSLE